MQQYVTVHVSGQNYCSMSINFDRILWQHSLDMHKNNNKTGEKMKLKQTCALFLHDLHSSFEISSL